MTRQLVVAVRPRYAASMPLHLLKLCVGAATIGDLEADVDERLRCRAIGKAIEAIHTTRMVPTRAAEILDGGSLYWVIRGQVAARQRLLGIRPFIDADGVGRCHLVLDPEVVPVLSRPCRPFQGWRYLAEAVRPPDLAGVDGALDMPEHLRLDLRELGLL